MKIRKHYSWVVVIGIILITLQIILDINSYDNCLSYYELCTSVDSIERCKCSFLSAIGIDGNLGIQSFWYFIGYNICLIIGIFLIIFERKQKNKQTLSKKDKRKSENKEEDAKDNDNKFMWE